MQFSSIWLIERALSGTITSGKSEPGIDDSEVLLSLQSFSITETSPSDFLVPYPRHSVEWGVYPFAEMQSVYSTSPANWAMHRVKCKKGLISKNSI